MASSESYEDTPVSSTAPPRRVKVDFKQRSRPPAPNLNKAVSLSEYEWFRAKCGAGVIWVVGICAQLGNWWSGKTCSCLVLKKVLFGLSSSGGDVHSDWALWTGGCCHLLVQVGPVLSHSLMNEWIICASAGVSNMFHAAGRIAFTMPTEWWMWWNFG